MRKLFTITLGLFCAVLFMGCGIKTNKMIRQLQYHRRLKEQRNLKKRASLRRLQVAGQ